LFIAKKLAIGSNLSINNTSVTLMLFIKRLLPIDNFLAINKMMILNAAYKYSFFYYIYVTHQIRPENASGV